MPAAAPKATPKQPDGMANGDYVYAQHPERGAVCVKVLAVGRDGFTAEDGDGTKHKIKHQSYLGHKSRMLHTYSVVDMGADGSLVEDESGRRRYLEGKLPSKVKSGTALKKSDDPILSELDDLVEKALRPLGPDRLGDWMLKASGGAKRAEPTKQDKPPEKKPSRKKKVDDDPKAALHKHGDMVYFKHGDIVGEGKIVGSGADGVTVEDENGREHQIRHDALCHPKHGRPAAKDTKEDPAP